MLTLDAARGAYARLPLATRMRLGQVVRLLPDSLKYGGTYQAWRRTLARARVDAAFVRAQRDCALVALVARARRDSAFYRDRLRPILGDAPADIRALDQAWHRLPVLSGPEVVRHARAMATVPVDRLDPCVTGGTSGAPVTFFLDRGRSPIEYAFVHEAWSRAGFRPGDVRAVFRGVEIAGGDHMHFEPALAELRCSVFHLSDEVMAGFLDEIERRRIGFLHGYPSALAIFAGFVLRRASPLEAIRGVLPASERLPAVLRRQLELAFPRATIAPIYGLSEKVAFATEVADAPETYAFDPLYGLTEIVDADGLPVAPGRQGRLVSTGLLFPGMPFLRYDTGDEAELVETASRANGYRLVARRIVPRHSQDYVVGRTGVLIPLSALLQVGDEVADVGEFQFAQHEPGRVSLRIVPRRGHVPDFSRFLDTANRKAAGEITVGLELVDSIPTTRAGKRKFIDQTLPIALEAAAVLLDDGRIGEVAS